MMHDNRTVSDSIAVCPTGDNERAPEYKGEIFEGLLMFSPIEPPTIIFVGLRVLAKLFSILMGWGFCVWSGCCRLDNARSVGVCCE